jgi:hypothetical protein
MKIINIENSQSVNINMSSFQGRIMATYDELVEKFGKPTVSEGGDKTTVEWWLEFAIETDDSSDYGGVDWIVATIYDWKELSTPTGKHMWHIGGYTNEAVDCVHMVLNGDVQLSQEGVA